MDKEEQVSVEIEPKQKGEVDVRVSKNFDVEEEGMMLGNINAEEGDHKELLQTRQAAQGPVPTTEEDDTTWFEKAVESHRATTKAYPSWSAVGPRCGDWIKHYKAWRKEPESGLEAASNQLEVKDIARVHEARVQLATNVNGQVKCRMICNDVDSLLLFDTGAMVSLLSAPHWEAIGRPTLEPFKRQVRGASGSIIVNYGTCNVNVVIDGYETTQRFIVCRDLAHDGIVGMDFIFSNGISMLVMDSR